jgi:membrane-bound lytic murein transglycosylase B
MWVLPLLVAGLVAAAQAELSRPSFAEFLSGIRTEAIARGIRPEIVDAALAGIEEPSAAVVERDRSQPEVVQTLEQYLNQRLTAKNVASGREMIAQYRDLLDEISATYNISPNLVVAIWGFESYYGRFNGVRPTVAALATLAWDPRRSALFRRELFDALEILNRGDIDLDHMRGSWAGAMGQTQFMPSSYLRFAEDYDGDGRRDIWSTPADVFASIANYMHGNGWAAGATWGREVTVPAEARRRIANEIARRDGSCQARRDMTAMLPVSRWRELGVRALSGDELADDMPNAALVNGESRSFLVYKNYDALLDYNCAHSYAIGVGLLSDALLTGVPPVAKAASHKPNKRVAKRRAPRTARKS